jgi:hypothetical protein
LLQTQLQDLKDAQPRQILLAALPEQVGTNFRQLLMEKNQMAGLGIYQSLKNNNVFRWSIAHV